MITLGRPPLRFRIDPRRPRACRSTNDTTATTD